MSTQKTFTSRTHTIRPLAPSLQVVSTTGIQFARATDGLKNDYLEDPVFGFDGMRRVREKSQVALSTNTMVANFEQFAASINDLAVHVILLDITFWGGIRACVKAAGICETFRRGVSVHSSAELGIQLASMLHMASVIPNLSFAADAHYHQLLDDIIEGGKIKLRRWSRRGARDSGAGSPSQPRQTGGIQRNVQVSRSLSIRPRPSATLLDTNNPQRPLSRSGGRSQSGNSLLALIERRGHQAGRAELMARIFGLTRFGTTLGGCNQNLYEIEVDGKRSVRSRRIKGIFVLRNSPIRGTTP